MSRLIMSIVMLVILAAVVAYNASNTTEIALPGFRTEDASVVAIALVSFVLGVIYPFLLYVFARFDRRCGEREDAIENTQEPAIVGSKRGILSRLRGGRRDRAGEEQKDKTT